MKSIFFCGDTHGRFDHVIKAVVEQRPNAVVFLGDLQPQKPLDQVLAPILYLTDVWFIHGNHDTDTDEDYDNLLGSGLAGRNLHGRVAEVAGVRIAGLGGIFRDQVWAPPGAWVFETPDEYLAKCGKGNWWRNGFPRKHRSSIFPNEYFDLVGQSAEVLVTHEAPSCHPHGFEALDQLARSLGASISFHGHHHDRLNYRQHQASQGFSAVGVGLCGITDLNGEVIVNGKMDDARANRGR